MRNLLKRFFGAGEAASSAIATLAPSAHPGIVRTGGLELDLRTICDVHYGLPHPAWHLADAWLQQLPEAERPEARNACKREWLLELASALGGQYRVYESPHAFVLSNQPANEARATLEYVGAAVRRVKRILEELAQEGRLGKQVLLVFPDADAYYHYLGYFYPDEGVFPMSAGVFLGNRFSGHFVVHGEEMWRFEPTIVHETTHSLLSHLRIPTWLNEGMAVNSEQRLTRRGDDVYTVREREAKHRKFWTTETIQQFWSGRSYKRTDEGRELSYDLGRILVNGLCSDWVAFKRFVAQAHEKDGGDAAARQQMELDLGEMVRHFLHAGSGEWGPRPATWAPEEEEAAFAPPH